MFNVMVTYADNAWEEGAYVWTRDRVLEGTDDNIKVEFASLNAEALERLATFPTLFMYETDRAGTPRVGRIVKIQQRGHEIRVIFEFDNDVPPLTADQIAAMQWDLSLSGYEFTRTHWAVKHGDLYEILRGHGVIAQAQPIAAQEQPAEPEAAAQIDVQSSRVFLVHGRDEGMKHAVARFLERRVGLDVRILSERPNGGRELLTKFQEEADGANYAIVLMSADDTAHIRPERLLPNAPAPAAALRARQNVIFELGFFIGKLGANRVCALIPEGVEKPSDFAGIVYVPFDDQEGWQRRLVTELHAAEVPVSPTWWQLNG